MLLELHISHLILIESVQIPFTQGFNVLSGETGSGKSAIMQALQLLTGERADAGIIRRGSSKGVVEALFQPPSTPELFLTLDEIGIDYSHGEPLLLRREISLNGKSRALINDQAVTLAQLKQIGSYLIEIVGQHANQMLLTVEQHRRILDDFGGLSNQVAAFHSSWTKENSLRKSLNEMISNESARLREIERIEFEIEEIEAAHLKEGEEEDLFSEYTLLSNAEERSQKAFEVLSGITNEKNGLLANLRKQKTTLENLEQLDPSVTEACKLHQSALFELEEVGYLLTQYQSHIEVHPERLQPIDERLKLLIGLKKKYGGTYLEIHSYHSIVKKRLAELESADHQIESLREELAKLEGENDLKAAVISNERKEAAAFLEKAVQQELAALNMPKSIFQVELTFQKRGASGDEKIEFFLIPNVGEHRISIKDCASGGELSRIMLALQTLLAGKASIPTLIFDEIDANVGGETAVIVGAKLQQIGERHQVLVITHFPQVAQYGTHHLQISKSEIDGRTVTLVQSLDKKMRAKELDRMRGGKK